VGIKLPKIKVGKFLKKVVKAVPKIVGKVAKAVPVAGTVISTAEDAIGIFKKKKAAGQPTPEAIANTAASFSPESQTNTLLFVGAAVVILLLVMKGR
jgi:hypothetical protein